MGHVPLLTSVGNCPHVHFTPTQTDRLKNINEVFKNFIKTKQSKYLHPKVPKQKQNPKQDWAKRFLLHFLCGLTVTLVKGEAGIDWYCLRGSFLGLLGSPG